MVRKRYHKVSKPIFCKHVRERWGELVWLAAVPYSGRLQNLQLPKQTRQEMSLYKLQLKGHLNTSFNFQIHLRKKCISSASLIEAKDTTLENTLWFLILLCTWRLVLKNGFKIIAACWMWISVNHACLYKAMRTFFTIYDSFYDPLYKMTVC